MGFGSRLTLFDSQGEWVVGGNRDRPVFARRPIIDPSAGSNGEPLGWIGFTVDPRLVSGSDALFLKDQLIALMATLLLALAISAIAAYFLFDEIPDGPTIIGAAIIIASSLYIAQREAKLHKGAADAPKTGVGAP